MCTLVSKGGDISVRELSCQVLPSSSRFIKMAPGFLAKEKAWKESTYYDVKIQYLFHESLLCRKDVTGKSGAKYICLGCSLNRTKLLIKFFCIKNSLSWHSIRPTSHIFSNTNPNSSNNVVNELNHTNSNKILGWQKSCTEIRKHIYSIKESRVK